MERNISLDVLKLAMAFMVIGIHTHFSSGISSTLDYLFTNGLFRIAVPIFMIINGFYFHAILQKNSISIAKYFTRILFLYITWTVFYSYFWFSSLTTSQNLWLLGLFKQIIIGYHHLWYLSGLLGAATALYFLQKRSSIFLLTSSLVCFTIGVIIQYISYYQLIFEMPLEYWTYRNFIFLLYPFFCLGYLICKHNYHNKFSFEKIKILLVVGFCGLFLESLFNYMHRLPSSPSGFDNLFALFLLCPAIFIFFVKQQVMGRSREIALYATAIYLIHPFTQNLLSYISKKYALNFMDDSFVFLLTSFFSTLSAPLLVMVNRKIKYIL